MTKEEIQNPKDSEGIIFGSILVETKEPANDSGWQTFLKGEKASHFKYKFLVSKVNGILVSHEIIVEPNTEKLFAAKLDNGDYSFCRMWVVYKSDYVHSDTDIRFSVRPNKQVYIGKLVVSLPERVRTFSSFSMKVVDDEERAVERAKQEYEIDNKMITKELMYIK